MLKIKYPYREVLDNDLQVATEVFLQDHLGGFDVENFNSVLWKLDQSDLCQRVVWHQYLDPSVRSLYPNICIEFDADRQNQLNLNWFHNYRQHPDRAISRFLCSFNGSAHVSRKLLTAALQRFGYFDSMTVSKNVVFTVNDIDGHLMELVTNGRFWRKFFIGESSDMFFGVVNSFGHYRFEHHRNILHLEKPLTQSWVHLVSETLATSNQPFVTEKFLYSVVTRGLFLAYAQPGWHDHLERYYGFRKYDKIFDYRFDNIQNPVERLVELMSMLAKFSVLSADDWRDLYEMESETIEHNYNWYFGKNYLKQIEKYC
jgi:hypothetical protein